MADQELIDLNLTESVVDEIAAMTFADAQPAAIRFVRRLTRKIYTVKARARDMLGVDSSLFSTAELAAKSDLEQAFLDFQTAANAATTKAHLSTAWDAYQITVGLV